MNNELKYIKTFESFTVQNDEVLEEGIFSSKPDKIRDFVEKQKENADKLRDKVKSVYTNQLSKKGQGDKLKILATLDAPTLSDILLKTASALDNKKSVYPNLLVKDNKLIVGSASGARKAGVGTNA